ncbi:tektin-1-like [Eriocheir sinensis]|uniref:tektin-1-like n=1 Tax=Eriocheir sinensis TaxID=95602 RepID=UPI0021CA1D49|nr:tektin-1-like [Eriocheir sinensis]
MALLARERRISRSAFTRDYYRPSPALVTSSAAASSITGKHERPPAPAVPPRRPGEVSGEAWVPPPPINPSVWRASHAARLHHAHACSSTAQRTREENKRVCEETERLTASHRSEVERRLEDRIGDVTFWREEMSSRHAELDQDTAKLKVLRERLRKAHHLYLEPLEVALKCIDIRRERIGVEEVEDEVATALRQEVEELGRCRAALADGLTDTEHQLRRVLACRHHLQQDLMDKDAALKVEKSTARLTPTAPPTTIIPAQKIDPSPVSVEGWKGTGEKLLSRADQEHQLAEQVLDAAEDLLVATSRHLRQRLEHTDHCLRERIADTRRAKTLLEEEHAKVVEEERQLEQSLTEVEDQLEAKRGPLALVQTRLFTRARRPNMERTRDEVEDALLREVEELELTISRLSSAADISRTELQNLRSAKVSLEHDINLKAKTLLLDEVKIVGLRSAVTIDTH